MVLRFSTLVVSVSIGVLIAASAAQADTDFTWSGAYSGGPSTDWSTAGNWSGDSAPSGSLGTLSFPDLSSCDPGGPGACYTSTDDLGALTADLVSIDDDRAYEIAPSDNTDTLTLNGGADPTVVGMTASPTEPSLGGAQAGRPEITVPLELGADQQWDIAGDGSFADNDGVDAALILGGYALSLELSDEATFVSTGITTNSLDVDGDGLAKMQPSQPGSAVALPAGGVTLAGGATMWVEGTGSSAGPLSTTDSELAIGNPDPAGSSSSIGIGGTLAVAGDADFDAQSALELFLNDNGTTPGTDFSQLSTTGNVGFGGATLELSQDPDDDGGDCTTLNPGETFTLVAASGTLSGDLTYTDPNGDTQTLAPGGSGLTTAVLNACTGSAPSSPAAVALTYGTHTLTATVAIAPAAGPAAPVIGGSTTAGSTISITDPGTWTGSPAPTYSYQWGLCTGNSCAPIGGATEPSYTTTSNEVGDSIQLYMTATNADGSASTYSNVFGPLIAPSSTSTGPTTTTGTTTTSGDSTQTGSQSTGPSDAQITTAVHGIDHPAASTKAVKTLTKSGEYKAHFDAPSAGSLYIVWTTTATSGSGKHRKKRTVTLVKQTVSYGAAGTKPLTIKLTAAGRALLRQSPSGHGVKASYRFTPSSDHTPFTVTQQFTL